MDVCIRERLRCSPSTASAGCGRRAFEVDADVDGAAIADDAGPAHNFVFVTSTTHLPTTFGADLSGADAICAARASDAGLPGTYRAWLSTSTIDARDRLAGARGWVRTDRRPVTDRVEDLLAGQVLHPIRIDERGEDVGTTGTSAATGSNRAGLEASTCLDFSSAVDQLLAGAPWGTTGLWTEDRNVMCDRPARLYCFGIDRAVPLSPTPAAGRRAFVTAQPFAVGGGLAGADAHCASEASLGGLPETYLAFVATSTTTAAARFSLTGSPWVRIDGIQLAESPLAFMTVDLHTALAVDQLGRWRDDEVWTGASSPYATAYACADWASTAGASDIGVAGTTSSEFFDIGAGSCITPRRLYCLEP